MLERHRTTITRAHAIMDDIRADAMRAVLSSVGFNREDGTFIRAELRHHIDVVTTAITENVDLRVNNGSA